MELKISIITKCFLGIVFFIVCLCGSIVPAQIDSYIKSPTPSNNLKKYQLSSTTQPMPEGAILKLTSVENDTENCEFKIFYGSDASSGFVFSKSLFNFDLKNSPTLNSENILVLKCSKGSFYPVFIKYCGPASGPVPDGFEGPYCLSMWLSHPQVPETSKVYVRYVIKKGAEGHVGIKIGKKGDYRFVAHQNVSFLS
jgi:hypothetical protein